MTDVKISDIIKSVIDKLEGSNIGVKSFKEISYGIQFLISERDYFRVFYNNKGEIKYDVSQIKNVKLSQEVQAIFGIIYHVKQPELISKVSVKFPNIGTDESGKGDSFGPLVIAGVLISKKNENDLLTLGIKDSKSIPDEKIRVLANQVKKIAVKYSLVIIKNERYNTFHEETNSVNTMLAWGHARVIENILNMENVKYIYSDQFGNRELIENAMLKKGKEVHLHQQHKAEIITSVAAASILARDRFLFELEKLEKIYEIKFPKGSNQLTNSVIKKFLILHGEKKLHKVAKMHFANVKKIMDN